MTGNEAWIIFATAISVAGVGIALATFIRLLHQGLVNRMEGFDERLRRAENELSELRGRMSQGVVDLKEPETTITISLRSPE